MRQTNFRKGFFHRPYQGLQHWTPHEPNGMWQCSGKFGWRSNGGSAKGHPYKTLGFGLDIRPPEDLRGVRRVHIIGMFADFVPGDKEDVEMVGGNISVMLTHRDAFRASLVNGRHYVDSSQLGIAPLNPGDGVSLMEIGVIETEHGPKRVDLLTVELGKTSLVERVRFTDLGTPASFVIFDVDFEVEQAAGCPFSPKSPGLSFVDVAASVRVGDRAKFGKAYRQLQDAISNPNLELDEARGFVMMFLAMLAAAMLEAGTALPLHRAQLDAARKLDACGSLEEIRDLSHELVKLAAADLMEDKEFNDVLMNRAMTYVDRSFAKPLTDQAVAEIVGLSTSHFRFLFREATGQPFHKYLIALRLEKARKLLLDGSHSVTEVCEIVGFHSTAHFSRAFTKRFQVAPSAVRLANR